MSDDDTGDELGNIGEERRSAYVKVSCGHEEEFVEKA